MKIWIEKEYNYGKNTNSPTKTYRTSLFIEPKLIQIYLSKFTNTGKPNSRQLLIWIADGKEDQEFTFDFNEIQGLLIDVKDKDDFLEIRMKESILSEWKRNAT